MSREDEYIPSVISATRSKHKNCSCNLCHKLDFVTKLTYTTTAFYKADGFRRLSQHTHELWMCDECKEKLMGILEVTR